MTRQDGRAYDELRPIKITTDFVKFPEGSCLIECGDTKVLCCASIEEQDPAPCGRGRGLGHGGVFHAAPGQPGAEQAGHLQAEAQPPQRRDPAAGGPQPAGSGGYEGTGRADHQHRLRRASGGRRHPHRLRHRRLCGAGAWPAGSWWRRAIWAATPIRHFVTGVSAGIVDEQALLDLQYSEDSRAQVDLNCVMNELGEIIELQGTGEGRAFTLTEQQELVRLCAKGNRELLKIQKEALGGAL